MKRLILFSFLVVFSIQQTAYAAYRSPLSIKMNSTETELYIAEVTAKRLAKIKVSDHTVAKKLQLDEEPMGIAVSNDDKLLYVTGGVAEGKIFIIPTSLNSVQETISVGHSPIAPTLTADNSRIYVCNRFNDNVSVVDLVTKKEIKRIKVTREPVALQLSKDDKYLFVANHLPTGAANVDHMTSVIDIIDTKSLKVIKTIPLPNGAIALREMTITPDGNFIYIPSTLARFLVPTTQIERGWINTHAMNIIDVKRQKLVYTVLLDDVNKGAANAWGLTVTPDNKYIAVTHSGTNEVSMIDRKRLHEKLKSRPENPAQSLGDYTDYESQPDNPGNDLGFLQDLRTRVQLPGISPRGIIATKNKIYITQYYSGDYAVINYKEDLTKALPLSLGEKEEMDIVRKGEMTFHDATDCFQQWQSCSTCHPDVRTDAVNWDLLNDGIGSPKSTKSLLFTHFTPPTTITGCRARAEVSVRAGIKFIQFAVVDQKRANAIDEFLKSLTPIDSPFLTTSGNLTQSAKRGEKLYKGKANCISCHNGEYLTDMTLHNVGTGDGNQLDQKFDTPTLREVWRTAPYLYDGRAATMKDVLTTFNKDDKHGITSDLTEQELADLIEYVLSL